MPNLAPQVRLPWELHFDDEGRRFVRVDDPNVDAREQAIDRLADLDF